MHQPRHRQQVDHQLGMLLREAAPAAAPARSCRSPRSRRCAPGPTGPSCEAGAALSTARKALSIASTCGCSRRPASVSRWPSASREKRAVPTCFSSAWMRRATVVWSTASRRAALDQRAGAREFQEKAQVVPVHDVQLCRSRVRICLLPWQKCKASIARPAPLTQETKYMDATTTPATQVATVKLLDRRQVRRVEDHANGATSSTRPRRKCWRACPSRRRPKSMPPWPPPRKPSRPGARRPSARARASS